MQFYVHNKLLEADLTKILYDLRNYLNDGRFLTIGRDDGEHIMCTCPFHADGKERHPSFGIASNDIVKPNKIVPAGSCHCFTCGYKGSLAQMVADCMNTDLSKGEDWLIHNYGDIWVEKDLNLLPIVIDKGTDTYMSEDELSKYRFFHPYMKQRKLTEEVVRKFDVGYDKETNSLTFPVRDIHGNLLFITRRNVSNKTFLIPKLVDKPVYLLYNVIKDGNDVAFICESQINALTLWTWGYPGVALFGTGTQYQYDILKKSGIRNFVLCFDGDMAGRKGAARFKEYFKDEPVFIDDIIMPTGLDVNDIKKETFDRLLRIARTKAYI